MSSVLIVNNNNFCNLRKFITDLCSSSGINSDKIRIDSTACESNSQYHIIILSKAAKRQEICYAMEHIISNGTVLVNADEKVLSGFKLDKPVSLITYGFNPKSTVTTSSVWENGITKVQCCVQRSFRTLEGGLIEPQEFTIGSHIPSLSVNDMLAAAVVAAVFGADVDKFLILT